MEIANVSGAELKTLVMRMFREIIDYSKIIREEVQAMQSERKKNPQGTNSEGKEAGIQINNWEHKK